MSAAQALGPIRRAVEMQQRDHRRRRDERHQSPEGPLAEGGVQRQSEQGIQGHFTALGHEPFHYTIFYVQVDDISATLAKAESLGGKTVVPKVDIPGYGSFAWLSDPDENVIGLWKPVQP